MADDRPPPFRSCLYVPGHVPRRIASAFRTEADAVILDLEDSVPWARKDAARDRVAQVLSRPLPVPTHVRVNGLASGLAAADVAAVVSPHLTAIRIAKTRSPEDVLEVTRMLDRLGCGAVVHPLLESARAIEDASAIARADPRVAMLGVGESDLQADLDVPADSPTMEAARIRVVMASRAAGLARPAQSVHTGVGDPAGLRRTTEYGKRLGFFGRMTIHPEQIAVINEVHTPGPGEIEQARAICAAGRRAENRDRAIVALAGGRVVGPPVVAAARNLLDTAAALDLIEGAT